MTAWNLCEQCQWWAIGLSYSCSVWNLPFGLIVFSALPLILDLNSTSKSPLWSFLSCSIAYWEPNVLWYPSTSISFARISEDISSEVSIYLCVPGSLGKILCWSSIIIHSIKFLYVAVCVSDCNSSEFPRLALPSSPLFKAEVISQVSECQCFSPHAIALDFPFLVSDRDTLSEFIPVVCSTKWFQSDTNKEMGCYLISVCRSVSRTVVSNFISTRSISGKTKMFTGCHLFSTHNKNNFTDSHWENV